MEKPPRGPRRIKDWETELTDDWIEYAKTAQSSHCRNINANEKGAKYTNELFHKIDNLVLMHAFGSSMKKGAPRSDTKMNFNSGQRKAAENVRKTILKYGKIKETDETKSSVCVQVVSVVMMLVDCPKESKEKKEKKEEEKKDPPGLAQIPVFRVVTLDGSYCFVDQTARYYKNWKDYLKSNNLPRCKMCYPKNGIYKMEEQVSVSKDENNNEKRYSLDLQLSESIACTDWQRFKSGSLKVVSCLGLAAGVVSIVAAPFTGGASIGVYATYAATTAGWVSFSCMMIGAVANLGSMWDKFWHDESCITEIASLAMLLLHYGVAKYNAKMLDKLKYKVPVTRMQLMVMTLVNCFRFGVDSVMFIITFVRLLKKACTEGIRSITAIELVQFSMSAYFFGKTVFEPKTGYAIIKEAQRKYVMLEKRATIQNEGALGKYDEFVEPEKRFGNGGKTQTIKDDWKGITCSQEVCNELNANGDLIRNINAFDDLNQFFLEVHDTDSNLRMATDGNIMVNEQWEGHGRKLNEIGKTEGGVNERRRCMLKLTSDYQRGRHGNETLGQNVDAAIDEALSKSTGNLALIGKFRKNLGENFKDEKFHKHLNKALKDPEIKKTIDKAQTHEEFDAAIEKALLKANSENNISKNELKYTVEQINEIKNSALDGVGNRPHNADQLVDKDTLVSNFRKELNTKISNKKMNEEISKAFESSEFKENLANARTEADMKNVLKKVSVRAEYQYELQTKNFKFGDDRLFFEIDRKTVQAQFNDVTIDGKRMFENMTVGQADRLWRVTSNMGDRTDSIIEAAKNMAEKLQKNDPREFADLMEYVQYKHANIKGSAQRAEFLNDMKNPESTVFQQNFSEFEDAIKAVREVQRDTDIPWSSETSAAYHYYTHGKDHFSVDPNETNPQNGTDGNVQPSDNSNTTSGRPTYEQLVTNMRKYLNEQWKSAIKPKNVAGQGHSQDGRTFRYSYEYKVDEERTHYAYTTCTADTRDNTKISSHYCPSNTQHE